MQLEKAVWFKSIYFDTWIIKNKTGVDWLQTTAIQGVTSCLRSVINCNSKAKHRLKFGSEILHRECYFLYFGALYSRPAFKLPVGFYLREREKMICMNEWNILRSLCLHIYTKEMSIRCKIQRLSPERNVKKVVWLCDVWMGPAPFDQ